MGALPTYLLHAQPDRGPSSELHQSLLRNGKMRKYYTTQQPTYGWHQGGKLRSTPR